MPGVNITCNINSQLGNGGGEMKFEVTQKEDMSNLANCIANEIVNEILENALDIATMKSVSGIECDTIAFSVDDGLCTFSNTGLSHKMDNLEDLNDECRDIKDIIDGFSSIQISKNNLNRAEEPLRLDIEMKRLLSEMMSPPYDIVNYDTVARKDGVGDQPIEDMTVAEDDLEQVDDDSLVDVEKTKVVEKKTRVTDLVMNSKQVLSEFLMSDESRKMQEEWEEKNEKVIQVIELDYVKPEEMERLTKTEDKTEKMQSEDEEDPGNDEAIDDASPVDSNVVKQDADTVTEKRDAAGENFEGCGEDKVADRAGGSNSKSSTLDTALAKEICKRKLESLKKKKWNINLKFWGFGKKKSRDKDEESKYVSLDK